MCDIINMMPYDGCSQMLHISLKTEKSFIAHPWRLLCVVGLEEYSTHDWRAATSDTARSSYLARVGPVILCMRSTKERRRYIVTSSPIGLAHIQNTSWLCRRQTDSLQWQCSFNTLRPRQNGRHFTDDIFKRIFLNENIWIPVKISLKFVPKGSINNIPALVKIMACRRDGAKPLSEPMMVNLLTHICVTRPQWVNNTMISWDGSICNYRPFVGRIHRSPADYPHKVPTHLFVPLLLG